MKTSSFSRRLSGAFGIPKQGAEDRFSEIDRALSYYSDQELDRAATILIRKNKFFPTVGECVDACDAARTAIKCANVGIETREQVRDRDAQLHSDAKAWAAYWISTNELGRKAIFGRWVRPLQKLLVQKYELNQRFGKPDLNEIRFDEDVIRYFERHHAPLNFRLDLWVIFGEHEGQAWFDKVEAAE